MVGEGLYPSASSLQTGTRRSMGVMRLGEAVVFSAIASAVCALSLAAESGSAAVKGPTVGDLARELSRAAERPGLERNGQVASLIARAVAGIEAVGPNPGRLISQEEVLALLLRVEGALGGQGGSPGFFSAQSAASAPAGSDFLDDCFENPNHYRIVHCT
jgi:hypothetical protein